MVSFFLLNNIHNLSNISSYFPISYTGMSMTVTMMITTITTIRMTITILMVTMTILTIRKITMLQVQLIQLMVKDIPTDHTLMKCHLSHLVIPLMIHT